MAAAALVGRPINKPAVSGVMAACKERLPRGGLFEEMATFRDMAAITALVARRFG